jgi:hypothetical protein
MLTRMRSARQRFDLCIAVLLVLVVAYTVMVAISSMANRAALRNAVDSLVNDICTHDVEANPLVGCRVT